MIPAVATVLSAREWEHDLVALARDSAAVRVVLRAYRPEEVDRERDRIDVLVAGAETAWVTPARVAAWRRAGLRVIGVFPCGDTPARDRLLAGGADEVVPDDTPLDAIVQAIRMLRPKAPAAAPASSAPPITLVTGARGAPGRTEVALSLAWSWAITGDVLLVDLDLDAPALAVRMGRPPRPDVTDAAEEVHATGHIPERAMQRVGPLRVIVGSHRNGDSVPSELLPDVIAAAAAAGRRLVVDAGPRAGDDPLLSSAGDVVLVADGSPTGLVRAAALVSDWLGPRPRLVLNRVPERWRTDVVAAARRWTGLEPVAVLGAHQGVSAHARRALPPHRSIRRALGTVEPPA